MSAVLALVLWVAMLLEVSILPEVLVAVPPVVHTGGNLRDANVHALALYTIETRGSTTLLCLSEIASVQ